MTVVIYLALLPAVPPFFYGPERHGSPHVGQERHASPHIRH